jgi:hypothetical protein
LIANDMNRHQIAVIWTDSRVEQNAASDLELRRTRLQACGPRIK